MAEVPWHLVLDDIGRRAEALKKKKTNADRIRAMTDEELARFIRDQIIDRNIGIPSETWLDWLKEEVTANDS